VEDVCQKGMWAYTDIVVILLYNRMKSMRLIYVFENLKLIDQPIRQSQIVNITEDRKQTYTFHNITVLYNTGIIDIAYSTLYST